VSRRLIVVAADPGILRRNGACSATLHGRIRRGLPAHQHRAFCSTSSPVSLQLLSRLASATTTGLTPSTATHTLVCLLQTAILSNTSSVTLYAVLPCRGLIYCLRSDTRYRYPSVANAYTNTIPAL